MHISDFSGLRPSNTYLSVDVGKLQDYTAIAVFFEFEWREVFKSLTHPEVITNIVPQPTGAIKYELIGLKRLELGTPYPEQVRAVNAIHQGLKATTREPVHIVLDATGVGTAVADLFREDGMNPIEIVITAGESHSTRRNGYNVGKNELISALQRVIGCGELRISAELPLAPILLEEATRMEVKQNPTTGNLTFRHRDGEKDDLVLALAQGLWVARHRRRGKLRTVSKSALGL